MAIPESSRSPIETVVAFCEAWSGLDMDGIIAMLSSDIEYHNIPLQPLAGKAEVERYLRSVGPLDSCEWELISIAADGDKVLTERVDRMVVAGASISLPVMGVFEVEGRKIRRWRDYFDLASYRAQWPGNEVKP
jgi:limonene-1,2-epoxide hydrolase